MRFTSRFGPLALASTVLALAACGSGDATTSTPSTTSGLLNGGAAGGDTSGSGGAGAGGAAQGGATTTGTGGATTTATQGGAGGTGGANTTTNVGGSGSQGVAGAWCSAIPTCDAMPPDPGPASPWRHDIASPIIVATGFANHRGRDLYLNPGDPQWILAKFAYGLVDKDLPDEDVDIYLNRECGPDWELLGTATTTHSGDHATVEGVDDSGARVYFEIPPAKALGLGRHRAHLVVKGDLSSTDVFLEVVPHGTPMFVTDVDGTLTSSENAEFGALLTGNLPDVHPDAAKALSTLVAKGYHPMYLTARPEWLVGRTRELLAANGFPPGVVHTTLGLTGAKGSAAATYKTDELAAVAAKGMLPVWGFGNTSTDADAYDAAGIAPIDRRVFYRYDDVMYGGRRIDDYGPLVPELEALPSLCP